MAALPIAEGLFVEDDGEIRLVASTSSVSDNLTFPAEPGQETVELAAEGTLFTWTSQEFRPPSPPYIGPDEFERFGVGYVEFARGLLVEGRLTTCDPADLTIGQTMRTVVIPLGDTYTFGFEPVASEEAEQ